MIVKHYELLFTDVNYYHVLGLCVKCRCKLAVFSQVSSPSFPHTHPPLQSPPPAYFSDVYIIVFDFRWVRRSWSMLATASDSQWYAGRMGVWCMSRSHRRFTETMSSACRWRWTASSRGVALLVDHHQTVVLLFGTAIQSYGCYRCVRVEETMAVKYGTLSKFLQNSVKMLTKMML